MILLFLFEIIALCTLTRYIDIAPAVVLTLIVCCIIRCIIAEERGEI